jgi:hypothetical protein
VEDTGGDGVGAVGDVWWASGEQLIEYGAQRIEVGAVVHMLLPVELLRRHVLWRADGETGASERGRVAGLVRLDAAGDAEVGEQRAVPAEEDVVGFDVAVNQSERMDGGERGGDLHADGDGVDGVKPLAAIEDIAQGAVEQGHHEIEVGPLLAVVLDGHDIGVRELADEGGLVLEALDVLGIGGEHRGQDLDRDVAVVGHVASTVDLGHAADIEQVQQQIIAESLASEGAVFLCHVSRSISSQLVSSLGRPRCGLPRHDDSGGLRASPL